MKAQPAHLESISIPQIVADADINPLKIDKDLLRNSLDDGGAVLVRGFDFDLKMLQSFTHILCDDFHIVATRKARAVSKDDSYTTSVHEQNFALLGHTEGSYRPSESSPEICFFMCTVPPSEAGGETTLVDGIQFLAALPENIRQKFEDFGVTYEMYWEEERWQDEFSVNNISELKAFLDKTAGIKYQLKDNKDLHVCYTTQAIHKDRLGVPVFANAILAHLPKITSRRYENISAYSKSSNRVYFGNGEEISDEDINQLIDIHDDLAYKHKWQKSDLLVIDNTRYLHGRTMTAKNCDRKLISRFGRLPEL